MTGYITRYDGSVYRLPALTEWTVIYSSGDCADSFDVSFAFDRAARAALDGAVRFRAEHDGATVFTGVIDEYTVAADRDKAGVSLAGRGMAALLMDNEAETATYPQCTLSDMLARYVEPYGIAIGRTDAMGSLKDYTVSAGTSEWKALCEFAAWAGGAAPRFGRRGELILAKEPERTVAISDKNGVRAARFREKRYGVVSEVLVRGNTDGKMTRVVNETFAARGGRCRRIVRVPNRTGYDARRFTGEYVIDRSAREQFRLELSLAEPFAAFAGDRAVVTLEKLGLDGDFTVSEAVSWADGSGCGTELTLIRA